MYGYPGSSGPEPTREANDVNRQVRKVMRKLVELLAQKRDGSVGNGKGEETKVDAADRPTCGGPAVT
jgi:hypothetical protein